MKIYAATACTRHQIKTLATVKVYAARSSASTHLHDTAVAGFERVLVSYVYDRNRRFPERLARWEVDLSKLDLLLDSGAFTVWQSGGVVDLDEYVAWAQAYVADFPGTIPINLDVIPGTPEGGAPTKRQRDKAIAESERNADAIRAAGLRVMEVYHWHEPIDVLDRLLDRRERGVQVGIGGVAGPGSSTGKIAFVDSVFAHLRERYGWKALPPIHGLGISPDSPLGRRYPWYSIDANSWVYPHRLGRSVGRGGKTTGKDSRTGKSELAALYMGRMLDRWTRLERSYTALWESRGVRYAP